MKYAQETMDTLNDNYEILISRQRYTQQLKDDLLTHGDIWIIESSPTSVISPRRLCGRWI